MASLTRRELLQGLLLAGNRQPKQPAFYPVGTLVRQCWQDAIDGSQCWQEGQVVGHQKPVGSPSWQYNVQWVRDCDHPEGFPSHLAQVESLEISPSQNGSNVFVWS